MSKEGAHTGLDVVGIAWEPADAVNTVFYLAEGDWGNAAVSGISILPLLGDAIGKGGKYLLKASDLSNRS